MQLETTIDEELPPIAEIYKVSLSDHGFNDLDLDFPDKPSKPLNLHVVEVMKDTVVIEWEKPTSDGGADITAYIVEKRDAKRNVWATCQNVDGKTTTYAVEKLLEGNEYFFQVSAQNDVGNSEPATMDEGTVAKSPYGMESSSFVVAWWSFIGYPARNLHRRE